MTTRFNPTRDQLKSFLPTNELVKQFEALFALANTLAPSVADQLLEASESNAASAASALAQIAQINGQGADIRLASLEASIAGLLGQIKSLGNAVDFAMLQPAQAYRQKAFGQFLDTTTQTAGVVNTPKEITFNTTAMAVGMSLLAGYQIQPHSPGVYNFQFSIQLDKTSGGVAEFYIWPRLNSVDLPNSCSKVAIQGNNAEIFSAANFFIDVAAGDVVDFVFAVSDLSVELKTFPASGFAPAIPSIILTVSDGMRGTQ